MKSIIDKHCCDVQFQVDDMVYIKLRPYSLKSLTYRTNEKLTPRFYGSYFVIVEIGLVAHYLQLPVHATLHLIFHVFQLQ